MSLRDIYNQIPVNMRTFVETVAGADRPITEADFTEEDLKYLRRLVEETKQKNESDEAFFREYRDDLATGGEDSRMYMLDERNNMVDITDREIADLSKKIKSYEDTRGRTSVNYRDIADTQKPSTENFDDESILQTIRDSFLDPAYRAKTTLGRFTAEQQEDGSVVIKDTYDWKKLEQKVSLREFLETLPKIIHSPRMMGNAFMKLAKPETAREVNIKLPDDYREGGSVKLI